MYVHIRIFLLSQIVRPSAKQNQNDSHGLRQVKMMTGGVIGNAVKNACTFHAISLNLPE